MGKLTVAERKLLNISCVRDTHSPQQIWLEMRWTGLHGVARPLPRERDIRPPHAWTSTEGIMDWRDTWYTPVVTDQSTTIDLYEATRSKRCNNQLHIWSAPNDLIDLRCQSISLIYQVSFSRGRSESFRQRNYPRRECCLLDFMSDTISIRIL